MKLNAALAIILGSAGLLLSGCETSGVSGRIQEKPAVFAALSPDEQAIIKAGEVEVGFTTDMVYLALGKPSKEETKDTTGGPVTLWTYTRYFGNIATGSIAGYEDIRQQTATALGNSNTPGSNPSQFLRQTANQQPSLELSIANGDTLYISFFKGRVYEISLASQQHSGGHTN